jgi:hypothetical protein
VIGHYDVRLVEIEILGMLHPHFYKQYLEHKPKHRPHRPEHHTRIANKQQQKPRNKYQERHDEKHCPHIERHEKLSYLLNKF